MNFQKLLFILTALIMPLSCANKYDKTPGVYALMETSLGEITIKLNFEKAPISTANFVRYAQENFYSDTIFHRVMSDFMIQGGQFNEALDIKKQGIHPSIKNEWQNKLKNVRGSIAMARTSDPDSATAQFYINVVDNPSLDIPRGGAAYAVFGEVVEGLDVVDKIRNTPVITHAKYPGGAVVPRKTVFIKTVEITGQYDQSALSNQIAKNDERLKNLQKSAESLVLKTITSLEEKTDSKALKTSTGLYYIVEKFGSGEKPQGISSKVKVHYKGSLLDGTVFDSSYARNQPIEFPLNRVIAGWTEGLQLMSTGEIAYLVIPPELGYGSQGAGNSIPPNAWLVFKVELLGTSE